MIYLNSHSSIATQTPSSSSGLGGTGSGSGTTSQPIDYMQLIVAQMQNMNPMDPSSGGDSTAEMMQAEELNLLTTLNQSISQQSSLQQGSFGASLLGKTISGTAADGTPATGIVSGLQASGSNMLLQLQSGVLVPVTSVSMVTQPAASTAASSSPAVATPGVPAG